MISSGEEREVEAGRISNDMPTAFRVWLTLYEAAFYGAVLQGAL